MRLGSWLFTKSNLLSVEAYYPFTKKGKGLAYQPFIIFNSPSGTIYLYGKRNLWSLLDALFPNDPLPRRQLNQDLQDSIRGKIILNDLLQDPDVWPDLRLQVKQGGWINPFSNFDGNLADKNDVTYIMSASASSSESDITPNLMLLEKGFKHSYCIPFTITTKTALKTIPAVIVPLKQKSNYKVIITDEIGGDHIVFSVIEENGSNFRPRQASVFKSSEITLIEKEIKERLSELDTINFDFPLNRPLDAGMKWYEMDYLEYKRFLSCKNYPQWRIDLKN